MTVENKGTESDILTILVSSKDLQKPIEIRLNPTGTVNDVLNTLEILPQIHHITSYSLRHKSNLLDNEIVIGDLISNSQQKTLSLELKYDLYNERSIKEHLIKTRDIVGLTELETFGLNSGISKISELDLEPVPEQPVEEKKEDAKTEKDEKTQEEQDNKTPIPSEEEKAKVSELLATFFDDLPQSFYSQAPITAPTVRGLSLSSWNPVPFNFKSRGHLIYISLQTLEGETLHITGSTTGFFINKSSSTKFDPTPREVSNSSFNLYDLISKTSKNFNAQIKSNKEKLNKIDPITFLKPQTNFLSNPWLTKTPNPVADLGKLQFSEASTSRDFNDEYQAVKELPNTEVADNIIRERLLATASYEFTVSAVKGAIDVINKSVVPLNPGEEEKLHIFLKDGIFYSFGIDSTGNFATKGGDAAARASTNQDLRAIKFFNLVDAKGVYTLLTTIVDYAGKRVVAQTPVPGLFTSTEPKEVKNEETGEIEIVDNEPLTVIGYGRDEIDGTIKSSETFVEALEPIRKQLHYKKNNIDGAELVTNPEMKGMVGIDKRKYVLDLYNSTPYDVEFIKNNFNLESATSYPHSQTVVRSEAVQQWYTSKLKDLLNEEAKKQGIDLEAPITEGSALPDIKVDEEAVFFKPGDAENDASVVELSKFITSELIPSYIESFDGALNLIPLDGKHLTATLHKQGINIRYLGAIYHSLEENIKKAISEEEETLVRNQELNAKFNAKEKAKIAKVEAQYKAKLEAEQKGEKYEVPEEEAEEEEQEDELIHEENLYSRVKLYETLKSIIVQEAISRASKHVLRKFSDGLPVELVPSLVSHFHNVLLGPEYNSTPETHVENADFYSNVDLSFTKLTSESVRDLITKEVFIRYRFELPSSWLSEVSPIRLLREIAHKFGIQWEQRDYHFTKQEEEEALKLQQQDKKSKKKGKNSSSISPRTTVFEPVDVTLVPIIKDSITRASTGEKFYETGRQSIYSTNEEQRVEGYNLLTEAVSVYEQTYGLIHPEVQRLYSSLSIIYQESGSKAEATLMARKALAISERVFGVDSHEAIVSGLNLAFLEFNSGSIVNSLKLYSRLFQIASRIFEKEFINVSLISFNIVIQLQERGFIKEAVTFIPKLIKLTAQIAGEDSFAVGQLQFRYAYLLALSERYSDSLKASETALELLSKHASLYNPITRQTKQIRDEVATYKKHQEAKAKLDKEILKQKFEAQAQAQAAAKKDGKKNKNVDLSDKSIDEVLNFVLGNGNGKKKKNKSKK